MKKSIQRVLCFILVLVMILPMGTAFAEKNEYPLSITLDNGTKLTEEEFINYLEKHKDEIYKISEDLHSYNFDNQPMSSRAYSASSFVGSIPKEALIGTWFIPGMGAVIITLQLGQLIIENKDGIIRTGSRVYNSIVDFVKEKVSKGKESNTRKVEESSKARREKKKLTREQLREYEEAKEALEENDSRKLRQLGDHALKGDRKGQRALDLKGSGRGRGRLRIVYEVTKGTVTIVEIVDYH